MLEKSIHSQLFKRKKSWKGLIIFCFNNRISVFHQKLYISKVFIFRVIACFFISYFRLKKNSLTRNFQTLISLTILLITHHLTFQYSFNFGIMVSPFKYIFKRQFKLLFKFFFYERLIVNLIKISKSYRCFLIIRADF